MARLTRKRLAPSIETFKGGVRIIGLRCHGKGNDLPPKRGDVKGWSTASRKRMRDFLLTHEPVDGLQSFGVTLTIPGNRLAADERTVVAPSPLECRRLLDHFAKNYVVRNGCGMVWRLEIQKRGVAHWHCILAAPRGAEHKGERMAIDCAVRMWWLDALRQLGKHRFAQTWKGREVIVGPCYHGQIPGADRKAVDVQGDGGRGAWLRYLQDHATKAKQEQIAEGFGRHWGVVGRTKFAEQQPDGEMVFSSRESYFRFWRAYHRLTRPVMSYRIRRETTGGKFSSRPFDGRSLGWSSNRGIYGTSVWFSRPDVVAQLHRWAEGLPLRRWEVEDFQGESGAPRQWRLS